MKTYVMSDIHGMGDLWDEVKEFVAEENANLVFLGDACDRGPDGYRIMKEMLEMPNVIYLMGNHEDMFVNACMEMKDAATDAGMSLQEYVKAFYNVTEALLCGYDARLYAQNGGSPTFEAWVNDGAPLNFVNKIAKLPICLQIGTFDFCHAGCEIEQWGSAQDMLWNREHLDLPWVEGRMLIHGHTSVRHIPGWDGKWKPRRYQDNKIDLDCTTVRTQLLALYCLEDDTFVMFFPEA